MVRYILPLLFAAVLAGCAIERLRSGGDAGNKLERGAMLLGAMPGGLVMNGIGGGISISSPVAPGSPYL